jgi:hypothetical protein
MNTSSDYITFDTIINNNNNNNTIKIGKVKPNHNCQFMLGYIKNNVISLPFSINNFEFNFMRDVIIKNNLKNGYELATGLGISTLAISLGMKETDGHLISCDSYQEVNENIVTLNGDKLFNMYDTDTYKVCSYLLKYYDTAKYVSLFNALSPHQTNDILIKNEKKLDMVFLDCPKNDEDFERDIYSICNLINLDKFIIFIHDSHCFTEKSNNLCKSIFNMEIKYINDYYKNTNYAGYSYYPLAYISNNVNF